MKIKTEKAWGCGWGVACSRLSDSGKDAKEKGTRKLAGREKEKGREPAPAFPSFLPFYFRVCAFSIQRTRLSRSLEQARWGEEKIVFFPACRARSRAAESSGKKKTVCGQVNEQWNILDSIDSVWIGRCNSRANSSDRADHENENNSF